MSLSRKSFHDAKEWAATYRPTVELSARPTRAGGTLFGLGKTDQSHLLSVDREFIWTVVRSGSLEYITPGKRRGETVVGYLVTDNPILFRDLNTRWAIGYGTIDWTRWEREREKPAAAADPTPKKTNAEAAQTTNTLTKPEKVKEKDSSSAIAAPFQKTLAHAASAWIERIAAATPATALRKSGFTETQKAPQPAVAKSLRSAVAPQSAENVSPLNPKIAAPGKPPAEARAKKRAKRPKEAPSPDLPFPEPATAPTAALPPRDEPAFIRPPRPKPRPQPAMPLPPEFAPHITSGPDPLPTPPPARPKPIIVDLSALTATETIIPPSLPPPVTTAPDPLPTPAPPPPPKRFRIRVLPVGPDAAQLDREVFGPWPKAIACQRCSSSGFIQRGSRGLTLCEACDGRGWNPRANSPLELKIPVE